MFVHFVSFSQTETSCANHLILNQAERAATKGVLTSTETTPEV